MLRVSTQSLKQTLLLHTKHVQHTQICTYAPSFFSSHAWSGLVRFRVWYRHLISSLCPCCNFLTLYMWCVCVYHDMYSDASTPHELVLIFPRMPLCCALFLLVLMPCVLVFFSFMMKFQISILSNIPAYHYSCSNNMEGR